MRQALKQDSQLQNAVSVIVAQRVSTVANADLIIVLDDGKVVGQGTHKQLMKDNPVYQEIVYSQIAKGDDQNA